MIAAQTIIVFGMLLIVWFVVSETISYLLCRSMGIGPDQFESDDVYTIRAGVFLSPVLLPLTALILFDRWLRERRTL